MIARKTLLALILAAGSSSYAEHPQAPVEEQIEWMENFHDTAAVDLDVEYGDDAIPNMEEAAAEMSAPKKPDKKKKEKKEDDDLIIYPLLFLTAAFAFTIFANKRNEKKGLES